MAADYPSISAQCHKIRPQVGLRFLQPELVADIVSMKLDGPFRDVQNLCNLLGGFSLADEICHLDLGGGKVEILGGELLEER